ncbi:Gfo/Idh/MocA family oxidoreductase [Streptosporangiaceae bacterium NEAU-GS5]|nr:Gfo/Idh/MocA family oxidoreductase [Streptosporangiaceae bacterium NEAU-GS5]
MRVGLVGLGRIGAFHAATLAAHDLVDELIVADADAARAAGIAARHGATARSSPPYDADAWLVATPTATHAALIKDACAHGIPVFCEKPAAPTVAQTLELLEAAEGNLVHIGFQRRFDAEYQAAREAVRVGDLGEVHRVHVLTADPRPPAADYIPLSGGIFRDCHIHDFDMLRWVTGREVESVYATGANRGAGFFRAAGDVDESAALLTMDDGTLVTLQGSRYNGKGYDVRMEVAGTKGTFAVGLGPRAPLNDEPDPWPDFQTRFEPAYAAEISAFLHAVATGGPSPCTVDDALAALYVAEAADLSRREGRVVAMKEVVR